MSSCGHIQVRRDSFRLPTLVVAGLGLATAAGFAAGGSRNPLLALGPLATLLGWSHLSSV